MIFFSDPNYCLRNSPYVDKDYGHVGTRDLQLIKNNKYMNPFVKDLNKGNLHQQTFMVLRKVSFPVLMNA